MTNWQLCLSNDIEWGDIFDCEFNTERQLITVYGRNGNSKQFTLGELRARAGFGDLAAQQAADLEVQIAGINKEPSRGVLLLMMEGA